MECARITTSSKANVEKLVLDSGAFIKQIKFESVETEYYTIPEVLQEVRDSKSRFYLETFPHTLKERSPHPSATQAVSQFAKKTGDYGSLSAIDIKILALTYTLEQEAHGNVDHLRIDPPKLTESEEKIDFFQPIESTTADGEKEILGVGEFEPEDDSGWISADNIEEYTDAYSGVIITDEKENFKVACVTVDFAMQNVLLQMNMNLVSVDGIAIKHAKKWINRCYSCLKLIKNIQQMFCDNCGSTSIHRVSYSVSKDGVMSIHLPTHKRNLRGTIYPIPPPKGGKNSKDLMLAPQKTSRKKTNNLDLNDPDEEFLKEMKSPHKKPTTVGYGKQNPNMSRKTIGKKNKTQSRYT